ncbi:MAG: hypothetical protein RRB13_16225 [bacterium]|nr:hypothetical protein [bacterium]
MTPQEKEELLRWFWALREQEYWHGAQDAKFLEHAQAKWPLPQGLTPKKGEEAPKSWVFRQFLQVFALYRWLPKHTYGELRYMADLCHDLFLPELGDSPVKAAHQRWMTAVAKLSKRWTGKQLYSATSKVLWHYHPKHLPLYDSYNSRALALALGLDKGRKSYSVKPEDFLDQFAAFFETQGAALEFFRGEPEAKYPYPRRVGEKYLWLLGTQDQGASQLDSLRAYLRATGRFQELL